MAEIQDLTATAGSHARFPEAQAPSTLNDGARSVEGIISRWFFDTNYSVVGTVSGTVIQLTANRASITLTATTSNYMADLMIGFTVGSVALTGPLSVTINGIGAISLRDAHGTSLSGSIAPSGARLVIAKDGTNDYFRLVSRPVPYAEGTWTPALAFGGGTTGITYTTQAGFYTKIGNRVFYQAYIVLSNNGSSTGAVTLTGFPFASSAAANSTWVATVYADALAGISGMIVAAAGASAVALGIGQLGTGTRTDLTEANFPDTAQIAVTGHYFV